MNLYILRPFILSQLFNALETESLFNDLTPAVDELILKLSGIDLTLLEEIPTAYIPYLADIYAYMTAKQNADTINSDTFKVIATAFVDAKNYFASLRVNDNGISYTIGNNTGTFNNNYADR
jgi:hypothetical protein